MPPLSPNTTFGSPRSTNSSKGRRDRAFTFTTPEDALNALREVDLQQHGMPEDDNNNFLMYTLHDITSMVTVVCGVLVILFLQTNETRSQLK